METSDCLRAGHLPGTPWKTLLCTVPRAPMAFSWANPKKGERLCPHWVSEGPGGAGAAHWEEGVPQEGEVCEAASGQTIPGWPFHSTARHLCSGNAVSLLHDLCAWPPLPPGKRSAPPPSPGVSLALLTPQRAQYTQCAQPQPAWSQRSGLQLASPAARGHDPEHCPAHAERPSQTGCPPAHAWGLLRQKLQGVFKEKPHGAWLYKCSD